MNCYKNRILKSVLVLLILILNTFNIISKVSINDIKILDSNSVIIYFNEIPATYNSELSADKFQISLDIVNADFEDSKKEIRSSGFFKDIYLKRNGNDVKINIRCKDRTGYTAVALPYSKSILIETFNWQKLNRHEENLRSGLLAIEDGLAEPAKKFLTLSAESGNPDAAFHLGIIQLYDGNLKTASKNLLFANAQNTKIPDNSAALAQIFKHCDMYDKYNEFLTKFKNQTGLDEFPSIVIGEIPVDDSLDKETLEGLMKLYLQNEKREEAKTDSLNTKFENILTKNEEAQKGFIESLFPEWFIEYMIYILVIFLLALGFIYFSFRKWKVQQIKINNEKDKFVRLRPEFDEVLQSANTNIKKVNNLSKVYQSNLPNDVSEENDVIANNEKIIPAQKPQQKVSTPQKQVKPEPKVEPAQKDDTESEAFGEKIDRLANQLIAAQQKQSLQQYEQELEDLQSQKKEGLDAKTKLAMHLQERDFSIKQNNLANLEKIPNDDKKIKDFAKNMKVEKAALDAKKDLNKFTDDKKSFQELKKKFETTQNNDEKLD